MRGGKQVAGLTSRSLATLHNFVEVMLRLYHMVLHAAVLDVCQRKHASATRTPDAIAFIDLMGLNRGGLRVEAIQHAGKTDAVCFTIEHEKFEAQHDSCHLHGSCVCLCGLR